MDKITQLFKEHHSKVFAEHGASARGVDWGDEGEMRFRYHKMLGVLAKDFFEPSGPPTLLDVGCGWGGLFTWANQHGIALDYSGIDIVESMIDYCKQNHTNAKFMCGDIFAMPDEERYDFVVCNGILTQRLTATNPEMEQFAKRLIKKMFALCKHGIAFNLMSNQVNFTVNNLFYKSPLEMFAFCIGELSPRVRFDHGYSSLGN